MIDPNDNLRRLLLALHAFTQNKRAVAALQALVAGDTLLTLFLFGQDYFDWWRSPLPPTVDAALIGLMYSLSLTLCGFLALVASVYFAFQGRFPARAQPRSRMLRMSLCPLLYGLPALWGHAYLTGGDPRPWGSLAVAFAVCYELCAVFLITSERLQARGHAGTAAPTKSEGLDADGHGGTKLPPISRRNVLRRVRGWLRRQWWLLTHRDYIRRMSLLNRSLYMAVVRRDAHAMSAYLARGADPNQRVVFDLPLLVFANKQGWAEVVRLLLEAGADTESVSPNTCVTPLLNAASRGDLDVVRLLLEHGAAVDACNHNRVTGLSLAARKNHAEVVRLLLTRGAQVNRVSKRGDTALIVASAGGHVEAVEALLEAGADTSLTDAKGVTALEQACRKGHTAVMALLQAVDVNARVGASEQDGRTNRTG